MKNGTVKSIGNINDTIETYLNDGNLVSDSGIIPREMKREFGTKEGYFNNIELLDLNNTSISSLAFNQFFKVRLKFEALKKLENVYFNINICNTLGEPIVYAAEKSNGIYKAVSIEEGLLEIEVEYQIKLLPNNYKFTLGVSHAASGLSIDWLEGIFPFKVNKISYDSGIDYPWETSHGYIEPETKWKFKKI